MATTPQQRRDRTRPSRELPEPPPAPGELVAISLRTARHGPMLEVAEVDAIAGLGLEGDHRAQTHTASSTAKRQVTLVQVEHLPVIASLAGVERVEPSATRRNLAVAGINLDVLRETTFAIGEVVLEGTGHCHPCSIMETAIGPGALHAMRGHGGITARILRGGRLRAGDEVRPHEWSD